MNAQPYLDLTKRQQQELTDFPMAYAFNEKQLEEALAKLKATKEECVTYLGIGDILKRKDVPALKDLMRKHREEMLEFISDPEKAEEAFLYEMDNHEYAINWDGDADVLSCFYLEERSLKGMGLETAYINARNRHFQRAREWEMI